MNSLGGYNIQDLQPGMSASIAKTVSEADIVLFAGISTDVNPMHLNEEWAKTTQ
ncbi:MAG: (R)-hydratase, partial [Candidatus Accumulibacter sp.]